VTRQNHNPPTPIDESQLATRRENTVFARGILGRLHGLPVLEVVDDGECNDCEVDSPRVRLGRLDLCRACAQRRQRAEQKAAS
jgi:hypothetical protein